MAMLFDNDPDPEMTTTALAPWFGSNRMLAPIVGKELSGCKWVGVPFAGGMSEVAHIKASTIVVSDLHKHVINLALCVKCPDRRKQLIERLDAVPFHPDTLAAAQLGCRTQEDDRTWSKATVLSGGVDWAFDYFIACWMGRSCKSGIDDEFNGGVASRWNSNGGGSNRRYRSAVESLTAWGEVMRRCDFVVRDAFEFLERCEDAVGHGIYLDPPFPGTGDRYKHNCGKTESEQRAWHRRLRDGVDRFKSTRVVCRFYDHHLIRELYPEPRWTWLLLKGRKQSNDSAQEVLIINGESFSKVT